MKKLLLSSLCTLAIGVGSVSAQSNKIQTSKENSIKEPLVKIEQPAKTAIVVQPITNITSTESKMATPSKIVVKRQTVQAAEPKKHPKQIKK